MTARLLQSSVTSPDLQYEYHATGIHIVTSRGDERHHIDLLFDQLDIIIDDHLHNNPDTTLRLLIQRQESDLPAIAYGFSTARKRHYGRRVTFPARVALARNDRYRFTHLLHPFVASLKIGRVHFQIYKLHQVDEALAWLQAGD